MYFSCDGVYNHAVTIASLSSTHMLLGHGAQIILNLGATKILGERRVG
jgi:hypothetical protein